jgi:hypothetical protein
LMFFCFFFSMDGIVFKSKITESAIFMKSDLLLNFIPR